MPLVEKLANDYTLEMLIMLIYPFFIAIEEKMAEQLDIQKLILKFINNI